MLLKDFEDTLKNIENDKMLMSYGNNQEVVNNILSIVNMVQSAQSLLKMDRTPDMFSMSLTSKFMELENLIVTLGYQRLMERGINVQSGMRGQFNPMMPNMPMYNQPMPQFMPQTPPQMPYYAAYPQQQYPQQPQQPQQAAPQQQTATPPPPQPQQAAAPTPPPAAAPATAPSPPSKPTEVVDTAKPKSASGGAGAMGGLPGMGGGGDEKAAGRDFLLQLLSEK